MKILAVSHEFPPIGGGGANACFYLTKGFVDKGHRVTLITANYQDMPEVEKVNGVDVFRVSSLRKYRDHSSFAEMLSYLWKALPMACKLQKRERFDICLVFFGIPSGPIGYVLKRKYGLPYTIRFGGGDIPGAQKRFAMIYKILSPVIRLIWKNAEARIANSQGLRERALSFYNKKEIEIICNGVDANVFYPSVMESMSIEEFQILFVSRLIEGKGLQFVIPELRRIQDNTDKKVKLIIVGDGPYREDLKRLTRQYGVEKFVQFEGQKSREELLLYYQKADVFILPSQQEGMPNVVLEAMACGLPIIMTPCEGSQELMSDNGYVISAEEFPEKLIFLANQGELCQKMGEKSRRIVVLNFCWEKKIDEYLQIIEQCVE